MEKEQVFSELKKIFKLVIPNGIDVEKITMKNNITTDLGINSIGVIYLAIAIEEMYGIDMSEVTFTTFKTIEDVIDYILENK
ncbi:MAG TPA: phosphopantetheine-binding protein [Bacilli bacterium]|jgi:acyl carrier protein|nr:phosphopantetheine-binding protein [Bacilli bacterium]HQQ39778.1 phosphopantetheine-binding protein [Bacilli bacterium]